MIEFSDKERPPAVHLFAKLARAATKGQPCGVAGCPRPATVMVNRHDRPIRFLCRLHAENEALERRIARTERQARAMGWRPRGSR